MKLNSSKKYFTIQNVLYNFKENKIFYYATVVISIKLFEFKIS